MANVEKNDEEKNVDIEQETVKDNFELESDEVIKEKKGKDNVIEKLNKMDKDHIVKHYVKLLKENEKHKNELKGKDSEMLDYLDRYKRTLADMENLRKRTITEKQESLKYANFNIIGDLLVVLDDFQRAIDSARGDENMDIKHFVDGVEMIEKQFADLLFKKYAVEKYCEPGDEFDPAIHLAMMMEEGDFKEETVLDVFRKGYKLHDRVIRPAEVKVGKPK